MLSKSIQFKLLLAIGLLFCNTGFGQDVSDYFHTASQQYIYGKTEECKQTIATALSIYPNDKKLIALRDKIKEEEKKKQQNQQNNNQQDKKDDQQKQKQKEQEQQKNISQEDANRILEAMQNEEKELQKKLKMEKVRKEKGKTLKNW